MLRGSCVYARLMVEMYLAGMDNKTLAEKSMVNYASLRRKMRGETPFRLDEAARIRDALGCGLSLEKLFERVEESNAPH